MNTASAGPAEDDADNKGLARELQTRLSRVFTLPKDVTLEPGLRAAASQVANEHLGRMKALLPVWLQEERSAQQRESGKVRLDYLFFAVYARMLNELAYWHLEPGDAEYEQATLAVLRNAPQACRTGDAWQSDFTSRILRVQAMPPEQQQAALATERRLLEGWGKPRPPAPPWPTPLPQEAAAEAIARLHAGGARPAVALAPILAWQALSERKAFDKMPREAKCGLQRWWLLESLAKGEPAAAVLNAFRYGTLITATDRYGDAFEQQEDTPDTTAAPDRPAYPKLAARFDVSGKTTVAREFDATGKPTHARVVVRKIVVRGIRGLRPIAFEDAFDAVSVQYALKPAAAGAPGTKPPSRFEMVWSLEASNKDGAGDDASKEKK